MPAKRLFGTRMRLPLYVDAPDLARIQAAAKAAGCSASTWARQLLVEAAGGEAAPPSTSRRRSATSQRRRGG
jgi:hypothetical protein